MSNPVVCPWWLGYFLISPLRRLMQNPNRMVRRYVKPGMIVFEPGPGMGFFTLPLAREVGNHGRVIVSEIQPKMLEQLAKRATKDNLQKRIGLRLVQPDSLGLADRKADVDLVWAFAVVHELPDLRSFFHEVVRILKPGAWILVAEPQHHVTQAQFETELAVALQEGLELIERPSIPRSQGALLRKKV